MMYHNGLEKELQAENEDLRQRIIELEHAVRTLTEQAGSTAAAEHRTDLFTNLINTLPFPVFYKDAEGIYQGCNEMFTTNIMNRPASEVVGRTLHDLLPHDQADFYQRVDNQALAQGGTQIYERELIFADQQPHTVIFHKAVFQQADGAPGGIVGAMVDITQRKHAEKELHMFKVLAEYAPDAIAVALPNGTVIYANPAFRSMFGYGDATIGMQNGCFFAEHDRLVSIPRIMQIIMNEGAWKGMIEGQRRDGSIFPIQITAFLLCDSQGQPQALPAILRDMSEQKRAEAERVALQQQVIDAQQAALRELSAPLIPIADHIVMMPLIGHIDQGRAQLMMETLLQGVHQHRATMAILDITGVSSVDTAVAHTLVGAAQAVRFLGAQVVLTGIQPQIAQTLVQLGVELPGILTYNSLQAGMTAALHQSAKRGYV
ncbi:MAG: PAS domain S-box protein [Chloroflexaceae bacterium]|nr:PAS domain S-box protein [Chloroflexaceae bacterium]